MKSAIGPESTMDEVEAFLGPGFALHGKVISGSGLVPKFYFLTFTDGSELRVWIEQDRDGVRLRPELRDA